MSFMDVEWSTCPVRSVLDDQYLQRVLELRRNARLGPIPDVGRRFAAWVPALWADVEDAFSKRSE